jgi:Ca-activated chloride channel family protein
MRAPVVLSSLVLTVLGASGPAPALVVPVSERSAAPYFSIEGEPTGTSPNRVLPLSKSHADVRIAGVIAHVRVTQTWTNASDASIEAVYVFPGSTRAAVFGMRMRIGERVLEAKIDEKAAAKRLYERARDEGRTASLLEQKRANVFQMRVANILPGDVIDVELDYTELLVPERSVYGLVIPQVVGPRYSRGEAEDWQRNPHVSKSRARTDWGVSIDLSAGMPIQQVGSPTHVIRPRFASRKNVRVDVEGRGGDRDFVFGYRLAGDAIETGVLMFRDKQRGENFFLMMMQPPKRVAPRDMPARELVFVVDVSGSMGGFPLDTSKKLMRDLLAGLRAKDSFNLLFFSGGGQLMSEQSVRATPGNILRATRMIDSQRGGGGTNLDTALERALRLPTDTRTTSRSVVLITDGYVSFEDDVFDEVRARLSDTNVFAFGIGSSVNRHLIEGVARAGLGEPFIVLDPSQAKTKAKAFAEAMSAPALTNIRVEYEGFTTSDVEPGVPADLLADRPLLLFGKYEGPASGRVKVTGRTGRGKFTKVLEVEDHLEKPSHEALRYLWARSRIQRLDEMGTPSIDDKREVTILGKRYNLLTRYTSFVAVDSEVRNPQATYVSVQQPAPTPWGVRSNASFGFASAAPAPAARAPRMKRRPAPPTSPRRKTRDLDPLLDVDGRGSGAGAKRTLSPTDVLSAVRKNLGTVNRCAAKHGVRDTVKMEWRILKSGRTSSVRVLSAKYAGTPVGHCLVKAIKRWRFPRFEGRPPPPVKFPFKLKG